MAISKSAKIMAEIEKVKAKISDQQARLKELEQKHNGRTVRAARSGRGLTPWSPRRSRNPSPTPLPRTGRGRWWITPPTRTANPSRKISSKFLLIYCGLLVNNLFRNLWIASHPSTAQKEGRILTPFPKKFLKSFLALF